jgi:hypothetical protein
VAVRGSRLTQALLLGVVVVVLLGAGAALTITTAQKRDAAASSATPFQSPPPATTAVGRVRPGDLQPAAGPSTNQTVQLSSTARSHPQAEQVRQLLQSYFDAINNHDYGAWAAVVTAPQTKNQDSARWLQAYASTVDSSIWIQSVTGSPLRVALRFTSEQEPDLAPLDLPVACIDWTLSYQLPEQDGHLVVGTTVANSVSRAKCT